MNYSIFVYKKENGISLKCVVDMLGKVCEITYIQEYAVRQRASRRYNSQLISMDMKEGSMILKQIVVPTKIGKFLPNKEGSYRIQ